jgi:serine/threonine-protein kinase HipA
LLRELPAAVEEVAAMAAGSTMLGIFAKEIEGRATEVRAHAEKAGLPDAAEVSTDDVPTIGASAYSADGGAGAP